MELIVRTEEGNVECSDWDEFVAAWEECGNGFAMRAIRSHEFVPWLKQMQPVKHSLLVGAFGEDVAKWPNDLLLKALRDDPVAIGVVAAANVTKKVCLRVKDVVTSLFNGSEPGDEMTIMLPGGVPMTFCWCPATTSEAWKKISGGKSYFLMGSPGAEEGRSKDEIMHQVSLTNGFWMGKCQVTQAQWESVMHENPSCFKGADQPVEQVSWNKCIEFISRVNAQVQATMSLPTEAQWEYSCRAGTTSPYHFGSALNGDKANCDGNSPYGIAIKGQCLEKTTFVGAYEPNAWGLCDMHGNVREWCADWYDEGYYSRSPLNDPTGEASGLCRVCRGGAWNLGARYCRSACRGKFDPTKGDYDLGLRLVCSKCPSA